MVEPVSMGTALLISGALGAATSAGTAYYGSQQTKKANDTANYSAAMKPADAPPAPPEPTPTPMSPATPKPKTGPGLQQSFLSGAAQAGLPGQSGASSVGLGGRSTLLGS